MTPARRGPRSRIAASSDPFRQASEAWNLLYRFARHGWLVAVVSAIGVTLGLGYGLRYQPVFHSEAQVRVGDELDARAVPGQREDPAELVDLPDALATAFRARVLVEPKLVRLVAELAERPQLRHLPALRTSRAQAELAEHIQRHALVEAVTRRIFRLSYDATDPELAQQVTQGLAELGVADVVVQRAQVAAAARAFLTTETEHARERLLVAEDEIVQFVRAHPKLLISGTALERSKLGLQVSDRLLVGKALPGLLPLQALRAADTPAVQELLRQRADVEATVTQLEAAQKLDPAQPKLAELERLAQQQSEMRAQRYTDDYPEARRVAAEIERIKTEIIELKQKRDPKLAADLQALNDARTRLTAIDRQVLMLRRKIAGDKTPAPDGQVLSAEAQYARLHRDLETARVAYEKLREREQDATITEQLSKVSTNPAARVEDPASRPSSPRGVGRRAMAVLGGALGLLVGLLVGLARALSDARVHTTLDLARAARLPVLGRVPAPGGSGRGWSQLPEVVEVAVSELAASGFESSALGLEAAVEGLGTLAPSQRTPAPSGDAEEVRPAPSRGAFSRPRAGLASDLGAELSTELGELGYAVEKAALPAGSAVLSLISEPEGARAAQYRLIRCRLQEQGDPRVLVIASSRPAEGASECAANLALACAEGGGVRVALLDANLSSPRQSELFGLAAKKAGGATVHLVRPNLLVIPAAALCGKEDGRPAEVLSSPAFGALLDALRRSFDCVIIDAPPTSGGAEAKLALRHADAGLLVVRARTTPGPQVSAALDRLGRGSMVGTVLQEAT